MYFDLYDEDTAGWRPAPLPEVAGPQALVLRRTVEPIIESFVPVQMIDVIVPQSSMGGVLDQILQCTAEMVPEEVMLVIEVPKISSLLCPPPRRFIPVPQMAEQLAEVPTILYFLKQRIPKQIVDNPVPHGGRGVSGGLQGFLPGHVEQTVDFPAPCSRVRRLQGFFPEKSSTAPQFSTERISELIVEHIVDDPVPSGGGRRGRRRRIRIWPKLKRTDHETLAASRPE